MAEKSRIGICQEYVNEVHVNIWRDNVKDLQCSRMRGHRCMAERMPMSQERIKPQSICNSRININRPACWILQGINHRSPMTLLEDDDPQGILMIRGILNDHTHKQTQVDRKSWRQGKGRNLKIKQLPIYLDFSHEFFFMKTIFLNFFFHLLFGVFHLRSSLLRFDYVYSILFFSFILSNNNNNYNSNETIASSSYSLSSYLTM